MVPPTLKGLAGLWAILGHLATTPLVHPSAQLQIEKAAAFGWLNATGIPQLGFPQMDADASAASELTFQQLELVCRTRSRRPKMRRVSHPRATSTARQPPLFV